MSDVTPDILKDAMPGILSRMDSGEDSEQLAESTVGGILGTCPETTIFVVILRF